MTPGARVQAAIECLERILDGVPAEKALTGWARGARYAGSKDRAAVRDHVYDVLRNRRSCAWFAGGNSARRLMIGGLVRRGLDPAVFFTGAGHAPVPLTDEEAKHLEGPRDEDFHAHELPDWLIDKLQAELGDRFWSEIRHLGDQADVFLRVNLRKCSLDKAVSLLREEGIEVAPLNQPDRPENPWAGSVAGLVVNSGARKIRNSSLYRDGLIELQDAASQAAMESIALRNGLKILDYCAGGGGKTLALAGRIEGQFFAHDANPQRMRDLPARAKRAGVKVRLLETRELAAHAPYDLVLCDVPCSGSGTWRRDPDAKWRFTGEKLNDLNAVQDDILDRAAPLVAEGGLLAYATCSLLAEENEQRITAFLDRHPDWQVMLQRRWWLSDGADGFFTAHLRREA